MELIDTQEAELAREDALEQGENIKKDYTSVVEARKTSKERFQEMSKSFSELAETNMQVIETIAQHI